jgi:aspartate/methionine/tyrosine aminotransferase
VVVGAGGVEVLHNLLLALTDPGDEVLLPDPAWPNFAQMAHLQGLSARFYAQRFLPSVEQLEELVSPRTRVLLVNSPSNPLGAVVPRELWVELVDFAERHGLWLISDECYDEIAFDGDFVSPLAVAPSDRVIGVYSFSKVYAMTGWRVGYCVAPLAVADAMTRLQEPLISCVNAPAQMAALAALEGPQEIVGVMREAYRERRDAAVALLSAAGVPVLVPAGAFYLWIDITRSGRSSREFAFSLIEERGVAVSPGTAFGAEGEGFVRVSMASELDALLEGTRRLVAAAALISAAAEDPQQ